MALKTRETKGFQQQHAAEKVHQTTAPDRTGFNLYRSAISILVGLLMVGSAWHWFSRPSPAPQPEPTGQNDGSARVHPGSQDHFRQRLQSLGDAAAAPQRNTGTPRTDNSSAAAPAFDAGVPEIAAFNNWLEEDLAANPGGQRAALERTGVALATSRRAAMKTLIEADPESSLRAAVPLAARQQLPPTIAEQLEERVEGDGELQVLALLDSPDGEPATKRFVNINGQQYRAFVYGRRLSQMSASSLPLHGIAVADAMAVHQDIVRPMESGEVVNPALPVANADGRCPISGQTPNSIVPVVVGGRVYQLCCGEHAEALNQSLTAEETAWLTPTRNRAKVQSSGTWTTGLKTVLFIRVSYPDLADVSVSEEAISDLMKAVNNFYLVESFGLITFQSIVTPVLPLSNPSSYYKQNDQALLADARGAAQSAGFELGTYDLDCVFCGVGFPFNQAFVGIRGTWLSRLDPGTACHEFGHNLGLQHANAWLTTDFTSIGAGSNVRYGNWFDTMGNGIIGPYPFNAFEKHLLGWVPDNNIVTVLSNGVYRIAAIDSSTFDTNTRYGLKVRKDDQRDYWVEVRKPDQDPQLRTGVLLNWSPWIQSEGGTELLDCHPGKYKEPALGVGQTFYDLEAGVKITPLNVSQTDPPSADVQVEFVQLATANLSLAQNNAANSTLSTGSAAGTTTGQSLPPGSVTLSIPDDGSYTLWVEASGANSGNLTLTVTDDAGDTATLSHPIAAGGFTWTRVGAGMNADGSVIPKAFVWTKGDHTVHVDVQSGQVRTIHLLATTDSGTDLPPGLSPIDDQWMIAGSTLTIPFFMTATGSEMDRSNVQVTSDNPDLVGDLKLKQTGSECTLTVISDTKTGSAKIQVAVSDGLGRIVRESFTLNVFGRVQALIRNAAPSSHVMIPAGTSFENVIITNDITLDGAGVGQTIIDGGSSGPTLVVSSKCTVQLNGVTIRNGTGGGIRNFGTLQVTSSSIEANQGTGVQNHGTLLLDQVSIVQNTHAAQGGGLDNGGTATLRNCTIMRNSSSGGGGGIINRKGATASCDSCCIALNQTAPSNGGGIWNLGSLTLRNCTVAGNSAISNPNNKETAANRYYGGGILNAGQLSLQSTTICQNQAQFDGGGLRNIGQVDMVNTLIADNISLAGTAADVSGTVTSKGHNLVQNSAGAILVGGNSDDILGADAKLDTLRDNGGLTETVALLSGSAAIDAGDGTVGPSTDQRGMPRPVGSACDIGAFEYQPAPVLMEVAGMKDGVFQLQPNQRYVVEASGDLSHWAGIGDYETDSHGRLDFTDSCTDCKARFYRVGPVSRLALSAR